MIKLTREDAAAIAYAMGYQVCPKCGSNLFAGFCQEHGQQGIVKVIRANRFLKMLGIADDQVNVDYPAPLGSF